MVETTLWIALTMGIWMLSKQVAPFVPFRPIANPLVIGIICLCATLAILRADAQRYLLSVQPLTLLVGPATVALAIPLWEQRKLIVSNWKAMLVASLSTNLVSIGFAWALGSLLGLPEPMLVSALPRMVTLAIALPLAKSMGGTDTLVLMSVMSNGVGGMIVSDWFFRRKSADASVDRAFALGTTSHAMGIAKIATTSPDTLAFASCGMLLSALVTTALYLCWQVIA